MHQLYQLALEVSVSSIQASSPTSGQVWGRRSRVEDDLKQPPHELCLCSIHGGGNCRAQQHKNALKTTTELGSLHISYLAQCGWMCASVTVLDHWLWLALTDWWGCRRLLWAEVLQTSCRGWPLAYLTPGTLWQAWPRTRVPPMSASVQSSSRSGRYDNDAYCH